MPRRFQRSSQRRRQTAWFASQTGRNAIGANAFESFLMFDGEPLTDVGQAPTLLRIRGWIGFDPDFDPAGTGPSYCEYKWFITAGQPGTGWDAENLEDENVLDTGLIMFAGNRYRQQLTAVGVETWGHCEFQSVREINVKAKRILRSPSPTLYLNSYNLSASGLSGVYSMVARILIQTG